MKRSISAIMLTLVCFVLTVPLSQAATIYLENGSDEFISVTVTRLSISGLADTQEVIIAWPSMTDKWDGFGYKIQKMEVWQAVQTSGRSKQLRNTKLLSSQIPEVQDLSSIYRIRVGPQLTVTYE
jgi:hypothetical protein